MPSAAASPALERLFGKASEKLDKPEGRPVEGPVAAALDRPAQTRRAKGARSAAELLQRRPGLASIDRTHPRFAAAAAFALTIKRTDAAARILEEAEALLDEKPEARPRAMPRRVAAEPGFILHVRPWSESSLLLDVLTLRFGRVFLVAKGAKRPASQLRGLLVPFSPLRFTWTGKNEAKILVRAEWQGSLLPLEGEALMSGFYVNELVLRMTEREDPAPQLFSAYVEVLCALADDRAALRQRALRAFEAALLELSGWPLAATSFGTDEAVDKKEVSAYFVRDGLLFPLRVNEMPTAADGGRAPAPRIYPAEAVEALLAGRLETPAELRAARDILREVIQYHLGEKTLRTRRVLGELNRL